MSDSIFNLFNKQPAAQTPQNNFLSFVQQVRQNGISPEQTVRQLVSSGRMSQDQWLLEHKHNEIDLLHLN